MNLWKKSGTFLFATGVIHNAIGFVLGWPILISIGKEGFINAVGSDMDRNAFFWFLFSGFLMMLSGKVMQDYIRQYQMPVPAYVGYYLLLLSVFGCLLMPASGIWLVLIQAFIILFAQKRLVQKTVAP